MAAAPAPPKRLRARYCCSAVPVCPPSSSRSPPTHTDQPRVACGGEPSSHAAKGPGSHQRSAEQVTIRQRATTKVPNQTTPQTATKQLRRPASKVCWWWVLALPGAVLRPGGLELALGLARTVGVPTMGGEGGYAGQREHKEPSEFRRPAPGDLSSGTEPVNPRGSLPRRTCAAVARLCRGRHHSTTFLHLFEIAAIVLSSAKGSCPSFVASLGHH